MAQGERRQARSYALQVLYAADVGEHPNLEDAVTATWQSLEIEVPDAALDFAKTLVGYVAANPAAVDERIQLASKNWRVERMSRVDRNILRLAVGELINAPEVSPKIVLNEAVELAKRFGADGSPSFVNGILDRIAEEIRSGS